MKVKFFDKPVYTPICCAEVIVNDQAYQYLESLNFEARVLGEDRTDDRDTPAFAVARFGTERVGRFEFAIYNPVELQSGDSRWLKVTKRKFKNWVTWRIGITNTRGYVREPFEEKRERPLLTPTIGEMMEIPNAEVRRILMGMLGASWMKLQTQSMRRVDFDSERKMWLYSHDQLPVDIVRVTCASTGREHHLSVPKGFNSVNEAVASTFGMTAEEYFDNLKES